MKKSILLLCVVALMALPVSQVLAFHDGGVAACGRCHTMHNSEDGTAIDPDHPLGNQYLLVEATPSDVCLTCHSTSRGAVWSGNLVTPSFRPGGDFTFLTEDNINDGHGGATNPIDGDKAGHNVIAPSKNSGVDPFLTVGPGGNFPSAILSCTSCHDPHGNDHFRLLNGAGPVQDGIYTFTNAAPTAVAQSYNTNEDNTHHTAYQAGMSAWCANCHGDYHQAGNGHLIHPSGATLGGTIALAYGLYNGTDDPTGGDAATSYLGVVPFEDPANTTTSTAGPTASSQVSCITCHRAHASSGPNIGRWDFALTFLAEDGHESGSFALPNPYTINQRSLCNKCHVKDTDNAPFEP